MKINKEPIHRGSRDLVQDSREIRHHLRLIQEALGDRLFGDTVSASAVGSVTSVLEIKDSDGTVVGYIPLYGSYTP